MIRVSAFRWVPTFARGLVRDLRVRWALEEAGLPYETRLIGPEDQASASYRAMQPFGQARHTKRTGSCFSKAAQSSCTLLSGRRR